MAAIFYPITKKFKSFYSRPVAKIDDDIENIDVVAEHEADFFSIYAVGQDGLSECVADVDTRKEVDELLILLNSILFNFKID